MAEDNGVLNETAPSAQKLRTITVLSFFQVFSFTVRVVEETHSSVVVGCLLVVVFFFK